MAETVPATALDIDEIPFADLLLLLLSPEAAAARAHLLKVTNPSLCSLIVFLLPPPVPLPKLRLQCGGRGLTVISFNGDLIPLQKYGLGSDVPLKKPDRSVSSFARLLRHDSGKLHSLESMCEATGDTEIRPGCPDGEQKGDADDDMENLGDLFKELGLCMMELGILVARACDIVIGGNQLEQSITDSGSAKARLIHYHSELDNRIIKEMSSTRRKNLANNAAAARPVSDHMDTYQMPGSERSKKDGMAVVKSAEENESQGAAVQGHVSTISLVNLWQEWHYDYGVLTVLTAPLFLRSALGQEPVSEECSVPDGHSHLQLFSKRRIFSVRCSQESFIVQVGEAAGILSGGKLRSTLHAVSRPLGLPNISRENFVVFLQPSWDKTLPFSGYSCADEDDSSDHMELAFRGDGPAGSCGEHILMQEILKKIPPLSSRLKEGMTFAEFSRQTTKRYYGGGGIQQNS
ncbi:hypothetical protein TRIUR3_06163 [Triticum urartu]|uniref:Isopenicillin N synthase-like Fe(2+) 2OG dioxygenase domain-containing protein n=1 Tax=Triticum urartu TaxID=4572 RepID=M8A5J7_TRIUA|nr:hypothetical protein TRIUR3_06163 [Triticum urartu]